MLDNNEVEGRKPKVYSYTEKISVSITEKVDLIKNAIRRIRNIKAGSKSDWISNTRTKDHGYWAEDVMTYLPRVGGEGPKHTPLTPVNYPC